MNSCRAGAGLGFSQAFPENRNQRLSIGVGDGLICAILVWWWFGRVAPDLRKAADVRPEQRSCGRSNGLARIPESNTMANNTSKKSAKVAKRPAAKPVR